MQDNRKLDNELADFTDKLLAGETIQASSDIEDLSQVITHLHGLIEPAAKPSAEFRARLNQHLDQEWAQLEAERAPQGSPSVSRQPQFGSRSATGGWRRNRLARLATTAAAIAVVMIGTLLILDQGTSSQTGSANGTLDVQVIVAVAAVAAAGLLLFWLSQRGKS